MVKTIIRVGSTNPSKIEAVQFLAEKGYFPNGLEVIPQEVSSGIEDQPIGLARIKIGAENRAFNSYSAGQCNLGIGLESGLMKMPENVTRYVDLCVCMVYDGERFFYGQSSGFEIPKKVMNFVLEGSNLSEACLKAEVTKHPYVGFAEGLIGILTDNKVTRRDYHIQALEMAIIGINKPEFYK